MSSKSGQKRAEQIARWKAKGTYKRKPLKNARRRGRQLFKAGW